MNSTELKNALKMILKSGKTDTGDKRLTAAIFGKPGIGKSQIVEALAKELGMKFIDFRLSQIDNTDLKGIPHVEEKSKMCYWASPEELPLKNNPKYKGTKGILFLDEINRASEDVLQSCFQLIYDYKIGANEIEAGWRIVCAGNLGEEDGCSVIELDPAMKGRMIKFRLDCTVDEWVEWASKHNIVSEIVDFIKLNGEKWLYFENGEKGCNEFVTPRQWTQFSTVIENNPEMSVKEVTNFLGNSIIGNATPFFIQYLNENEMLSGKDILNSFNKKSIKDRVAKMDLSRVSQLNESIISALKELSPKKITKTQIKNFKEYCETLQEDVLCPFMMTIYGVNTENTKTSWIIESLSNEFPEYDKYLKELWRKAATIGRKKN